MSYSIKRTPYFRRMFNDSRRNGQLQRLREEYERIQEFNDRTIELKMRQVRLKRLFREIEDINESPSISNAPRAQHQPAVLLPLSPDAQQAQQRRERLDALERARELGQEISRRNAELAENGGGFYLRSELRSTAKMRAADEARREAQERRQRAARRISYGNAQSRSNIERIAQRRQRQEAVDSLLYRNDRHSGILQAQLQAQIMAQNQQHPDDVKRSMLQQRLQYGNLRSTKNMMRSQIAAAQRVMNGITEPELATNNENLRRNRDMHLQLEMEQEALQLQMEPEQEELQQHSAKVTGTHAEGAVPSHINTIDNNVSHSKPIADSESEMQTAMLPPTEPDAICTSQFSDGDMPSTSQKALRMSEMAATANASGATTISGFQSPRPSRILGDSASERASEHWHRISLTLPWIKVVHDRNVEMPPPQQLQNISISIGEDLNNHSDTSPSVGTPHRYQSFRGPSFMQEDLMQIMELDANGHETPHPSVDN